MLGVYNNVNYFQDYNTDQTIYMHISQLLVKKKDFINNKHYFVDGLR